MCTEILYYVSFLAVFLFSKNSRQHSLVTFVKAAHILQCVCDVYLVRLVR